MTRDWAFCRWLAYEYGVIAIPTSAFYGSPPGHTEEEGGRSLVRFTFCKTDETLDAAAKALRRLGANQREREGKEESAGQVERDGGLL
jgi:aspartate/methionine/tyrosine aminotransferase